jgi:pimeloyl-ACP methyl ester carboxylesterase
VFPRKVEVECGYIRVPEDRSHPQGRTIRVAAAVVGSRSEAPSAEPVLVLPGGPAAGAITRFYYANFFQKSSWARDHDLVFVDTRGTGLSRPRLGCPEVDQTDVPLFYNRPYVLGRGLKIMGSALDQCRRRLLQQGLRPRAYTTSASVDDLEALRESLAVDRWNVLSISADGLLGLSYMREHPESVRANIVDSGMSTQMQGLLDYERGLADLLDGVFAGCAANQACRTRYPHLRRGFMRLVSRLNTRPRVIRFPDFRPRPVRLRLDGMSLYKDVMLQVFPGNAFVPNEIPHLIDNMWRQSHGELRAVYQEQFGTGPVTNGNSDHFVALGRTMSAECHDITNFITPAERRRAVRDLPMMADRYLDRHFDLTHFFADPRSPAGCRIWRAGRAPAEQHRPVSSSVPTLVLAGEFDTGVPPLIVRQVDDRLSRSTYVEFPASAHLQLASYNVGSDCARSIAAAFLAEPENALDTSCVDALPDADFTPTPPVGEPRTAPRIAPTCRVWFRSWCAIDLQGGPATR